MLPPSQRKAKRDEPSHQEKGFEGAPPVIPKPTASFSAQPTGTATPSPKSVAENKEGKVLGAIDFDPHI